MVKQIFFSVINIGDIEHWIEQKSDIDEKFSTLKDTYRYEPSTPVFHQIPQEGSPSQDEQAIFWWLIILVAYLVATFVK